MFDLSTTVQHCQLKRTETTAYGSWDHLSLVSFHTAKIIFGVELVRAHWETQNLRVLSETEYLI